MSKYTFDLYRENEEGESEPVGTITGEAWLVASNMSMLADRMITEVSDNGGKPAAAKRTRTAPAGKAAATAAQAAPTTSKNPYLPDGPDDAPPFAG